MNRFMILTLLLITAVVTGCSIERATGMRAVNLRCEYLRDPMGIDVTRPRLSWEIEADGRGRAQTAYRIIVASSPENLEKNTGDLWDTGRVRGDQTAHIEYDGAPLDSRARCWWKVRVWDEEGAQSDFSDTAMWTVGLLGREDWKADWIGMALPEDYGAAEDNTSSPPPPHVRTDFTLDSPVERATAYVTARGLFTLFLNGERVGEDVFAPEYTDYFTRIQYRTYDVTDLLSEGDNAVGAIIGEGWFSGRIGWLEDRGLYGDRNSVLVQIEVERADGSSTTIVSDATWKCAEGPIRQSSMLMGEDYDARMELPGWNEPGYDDSGWDAVVVEDYPEAELVAQMSQPVRVTGEIEPVAVNEPEPGMYVFDMGQNMVGWARLRVAGDSGTKVRLRFAEMLNPDGTIYTENLRSARATETYICKGEGIEEYEPSFTFHGFRYVEVTGYPGEPGMDAVTGRVVHSDMPVTGEFACSSDLVNQLYSNIVWGQKGNFLSIPTDCPQRDERMGWMGDAQIFVRTATYNMDVAAFFTKWMQDVEDAQSVEGSYADISPNIWTDDTYEGAPGWGDAGIIVPWTIYRVYGDTRIIERHWDSMEQWMDYLLAANPDYLWRNRMGNNYGDWLSINANTPKDILSTAFWAYDANLMGEMADATGRNDDAAKYRELFENIKAAFQDAFITPDGRVMPVERGGEDTQTAYLLALAMDLMPAELRDAAVEHLNRRIEAQGGHLSTGFLGVRYLNPVLTAEGENDIAYRLLLTETYPSWLYPVLNGATTIWERWDGWTEERGFQDPGMNSFNHYSFGSIGEWLFGDVAGIGLDPDAPGFTRAFIHPRPGPGLDWVRASYHSLHGAYASEWERDGDTFRLTVTVPPNTAATVLVPADEGAAVTESGKPVADAEGVTAAGYDGGFARFEVTSGTFEFESTLTE